MFLFFVCSVVVNHFNNLVGMVTLSIFLYTKLSTYKIFTYLNNIKWLLGFSWNHFFFSNSLHVLSQRRIHSSRMRTARLSGRLGGGVSTVVDTPCPMACLDTHTYCPIACWDTPPWTDRHCENITFPQLLLRSIKLVKSGTFEYIGLPSMWHYHFQKFYFCLEALEIVIVMMCMRCVCVNRVTVLSTVSDFTDLHDAFFRAKPW